MMVFITVGMGLNFDSQVLADESPSAAGAKEQAAENPKFEKAYELYNKAQFDEAITIFEDLLKSEPSNVKGQVYYGVCFMGKEQFDRAIVELEKALKLDGKFPLTNYALAVSYARKEPPDAKKAEDYLTLSKKYGYQVPVWFEQYVERLKTGKTTPPLTEKTQ